MEASFHSHNDWSNWIEVAIVLSLVTLAFRFSNTSFSSALHFNFVFLWVSSRRGAISDAYLGMNFDRYLVMPRKLLTASSDFGGLLFLQL